jgi:hypothetical protein
LERVDCALLVALKATQKIEQSSLKGLDKFQKCRRISALELPDKKPLAESIKRLHVRPLRSL